MSYADRLLLNDPSDKEIKKLKEEIEKLPLNKLAALKYNFHFNARPKQIAPKEEWQYWVILSGRGFGKTYAGAGWIIDEINKAEKEGRAKGFSVGIIGSVYEDIVKSMVQQIIDLYPDGQAPVYNAKQQRLFWKNGATADIVAAGEEPNKLRSKNFNIAWVDELVKFKYAEEAWKQLTLCTRKPPYNKILVTTTPLRGSAANKILKSLKEQKFGKAIFTYGTSLENPHTTESYRQSIINIYKGTSIESQEIHGQLLDDVSANSLWKYEMFKYFDQFIKEEIDKLKLKNKDEKFIKEYLENYFIPSFGEIRQIIVSVDPATSNTAHSNETGIIVAAKDKYDRGFVLEDKSGKYSPNQWAEISVGLFEKWNCKLIVAEKNQGGDMVKSVIQSCNPKVPVELVHATKGKLVRAEPVARLYEQGRIYHCGANRATFEILESQMTTFNGEKEKKSDEESTSPDRMDALVWAFSYLFSDMLKVPARGSVAFQINPYLSGNGFANYFR